jgi:hypothetical protein
MLDQPLVDQSPFSQVKLVYHKHDIFGGKIMAITLDPRDKASLRKILENRFSLDELKTLAFDLGVAYDRLPHETVTQFSMELVRYFEREGNLNCLVTAVQSQRHDDFLAQLSTKLPPCSPKAQPGGVMPQVSLVGLTLEDVMTRIDAMHLDLGNQVGDLKRGQIAIYRHISSQNQAAVEQIIGAVNQGRIEQGEVARALESIRRVLKYAQESDAVADQELKHTLAEIYQSVNSNLGFQQQFELSLPVIPFLLDYKVNLGAGVDLGAMWQELLNRIRIRG